MKTGFFCLLLFLCATRAAAQPSFPTKDISVKKPELFRDLPKRIAVEPQRFLPLLQKEIGAHVSLMLHSGFPISGVVVSKSDAAETRYKTVVLKCTNRSGAALAITAVRQSDGSYRYSGRLLSLHHSDAYELVEDAGQFALQKLDASDLVTE